MRPLQRLAVLVVASILAAGCGGKGDPSADPTESFDPNVLPEGVTNVLEGIVQGPDLAPIGNATVAINGFDDNRTTDEGGYYRFESLPPRDYILTATKEGYRPKSQRAIIENDKIFQLDFVLEEIPLQRPYNNTQEWSGLVSCQAAYQTTPDNTQRPNCGTNDPGNKQEKKWQVEPGAAQLQIELVWQPVTAAADHLTITIETPEGNGVVFAYDTGPSILKAVVSQSLLKSNLPSGGIVRTYVESGVSLTGEEAGTDIGLAFQQPFKIYFTTFYIEPGPPTFSALK